MFSMCFLLILFIVVVFADVLMFCCGFVMFEIAIYSIRNILTSTLGPLVY